MAEASEQVVEGRLSSDKDMAQILGDPPAL